MDFLREAPNSKWLFFSPYSVLRNCPVSFPSVGNEGQSYPADDRIQDLGGAGRGKSKMTSLLEVCIYKKFERDECYLFSLVLFNVPFQLSF